MNELLLHTYSRYCRLFFEDFKVFADYKTAVKEMTSSMETLKWQNDILKFEMDFGINTLQNSVYSYDNNQSPLIPYLIEDEDDLQRMSLEPPKIFYNSFSPESSQPQNLSLPFSLIYHMVKKAAPPYHLQKLYFSSKLFFRIKQNPICYKLDISSVYHSSKIIYGNTLFISPQTFSISKILPNFKLTKILSLSKMPMISLSKIIPKIAKINIEELYLFEQRISLKDLMLLAPEIKIFGLNQFSCIINDNQLAMTAPQIICKMPKLETAIFNTGMKMFPNLGENDDEILSPKKLVNTLKSFFALLLPYMEFINNKAICKFIKNYATSNSHFQFIINKSAVVNYYELDNEAAQNLLQTISETFIPMNEDSSATKRCQTFKLTLNKNDYYFLL